MFCLFCYVDDILLASSSFSDHVIHLRDVLHNLSVHNLVINPTKTPVSNDITACSVFVIAHVTLWCWALYSVNYQPKSILVLGDTLGHFTSLTNSW